MQEKRAQKANKAACDKLHENNKKIKDKVKDFIEENIDIPTAAQITKKN